MNTIELIYGERVVDDWAFCQAHNEVLDRYSHGIMTVQASPRVTLEGLAVDPTAVPGWRHSLREHPDDIEVLREFLRRLVAFYDAIRKWN